MDVPHKYRVVWVIALVLKILACLALAAGLVVAILAAFGGGGSAAPIVNVLRSLGLVIGPLVGIVWFIQLFALGSILSLLVDIEENTRALSEMPSASAAPLDLA